MKHLKSFVNKAGLFVACLSAATALTAQQPATIAIETKNSAVVLQVDKDKRLLFSHVGDRADGKDYSSAARQLRMDDGNNAINNHAYTPAGTWNLVEPAIQVTHADGNNSLELLYVSHSSKKENDNIATTSIVLRDPVYPFEVTLYFKTYANENIIEQWSEIKHTEKKAVQLRKYASANLYFTGDRYFLHHFSGGWAREMNAEETELTAGIKTLDSKLGTRANLFQPPSFYLSFNEPATERSGSVLMGTLAWTGNFKFDFEKDAYGNLRVISGINPFASTYTLQPGLSFVTPSFIYTYSNKGKGQASRDLHDWARKYRLMNGTGERFTLLNNWEATYFDFDENKLVDLFKGAKELGVDLFLLDDGWFGNKYPRNNDSAGLGDWQENTKKLPHGIGYLVSEATKAGIGFGIWVEPEMVNPKSELYEKHRDWVLRQPQRPEHYFRNQLVLDLSNPEVQDFVFGVLDTILSENPRMAYIKWDCNAVIYNAHSAYLERKKLPQDHIYVEYVRGLYNVLKKVRSKYPKIPMMLCSGGGGRVDYEALKYFTEFWPSDNTDPLERIYIQWQNSYFFPSIASCNHVTNWGSQPLKFKVDVAMMGKLGFDIVVSKLSASDLSFGKQALKVYDSISPLVWHGDLYRLADPTRENIASLMYVNKERSKAVMFNYLANTRYLLNARPTPVKFDGLDAAKRYTVREVNSYTGERGKTFPDAYSGEYLMSIGLNPDVSNNRPSVVLMVEEAR
jgi:alpha-galactosidase